MMARKMVPGGPFTTDSILQILCAHPGYFEQDEDDYRNWQDVGLDLNISTKRLKEIKDKRKDKNHMHMIVDDVIAAWVKEKGTGNHAQISDLVTALKRNSLNVFGEALEKAFAPKSRPSTPVVAAAEDGDDDIFVIDYSKPGPSAAAAATANAGKIVNDDPPKKKFRYIYYEVNKKPKPEEMKVELMEDGEILSEFGCSLPPTPQKKAANATATIAIASAPERKSSGDSGISSASNSGGGESHLQNNSSSNKRETERGLKRLPKSSDSEESDYQIYYSERAKKNEEMAAKAKKGRMRSSSVSNPVARYMNRVIQNHLNLKKSDSESDERRGRKESNHRRSRTRSPRRSRSRSRHSRSESQHERRSGNYRERSSSRRSYSRSRSRRRSRTRDREMEGRRIPFSSDSSETDRRSRRTPESPDELPFAVYNPFHNAIIENKASAVIDLLLSGKVSKSEINSRTEDGIGNTALHLAARYIDNTEQAVELIKALIIKGAQVDKRNTLGHTFMNGLLYTDKRRNILPMNSEQCLIIFKFLIEEGYSRFLLSEEKRHWVVLHYAMKEVEMKEDVIRLLHFKEINLNFVNSRGGDSCLYYAVWGGRSLDMLKSLVRFGADVKHINRARWNLLHVAAHHRHLEAFQYFLEELEKRKLAFEYLFAKNRANLTPIDFVRDKFARDKKALETVLGLVEKFRKSSHR